MAEIKVEFAVQMTGEQWENNIRNALSGMGKLEVDNQQGRIIVHTKEPWYMLQEKIEASGCKAVLAGFGGQSAVSIINTTGSDVDRCPIQGVIRFTAIRNDKPGVVVDGVVDGLTPGLHGIHVHESGDVSAGCASVGGHYNPRGSPHGSPNDDASQRHAGDLGNIRADDNGRATFRFMDNILEVYEIIGRSVVITQNPDDFGRGGNEQSRVDGNSGERIACGIIARSAGILQNFKKICACDGVTLWDERYKPIAGGTRAQKL
ncbi:superoxide dismutase 1, soluble [Musca domestica]|uniref:Superoxide dismutase [Cu-Zn] n=2 Tax=Musca domestica TaxID=7370 RepID=G3GJ66_MUSDO|nr:superoxide dismutase 1, soluble [Musca domestica]AEO50700.1 superoxide dismutase 1 [Musca domestica]